MPIVWCLLDSIELCAQLSDHLTGISMLVLHDSLFPRHPHLSKELHLHSNYSDLDNTPALPLCISRAVVTGCCVRKLLEQLDLRGPKVQAHTKPSSVKPSLRRLQARPNLAEVPAKSGYHSPWFLARFRSLWAIGLKHQLPAGHQPNPIPCHKGFSIWQLP